MTISDHVIKMIHEPDPKKMANAIRDWGHSHMTTATRDELWLVIGVLCGVIARSMIVPPDSERH
jgi:hypothetical protein